MIALVPRGSRYARAEDQLYIEGAIT